MEFKKIDYLKSFYLFLYKYLKYFDNFFIYNFLNYDIIINK